MDFNNCSKWNVNRYVTANYLLVASFFRGSEKKYAFVLTDLLSLLLFQRSYVFICLAFSYSFIYLFILYSMTCQIVLGGEMTRFPSGCLNFCTSATTKLNFCHYLTHTAKSNQSIYTVERLFSMWVFILPGLSYIPSLPRRRNLAESFFSRIKCIGNCNKFTETFNTRLRRVVSP